MLQETTFSLSRKAPQAKERRQDERTLTLLRVGSLLVAGERELCLVRNISAGGMMAHVYSHLEIGREVGVELKTDESIPARVIWAQDGNVGFEFESPIDVEEMLASGTLLPDGRQPRAPRIEVDRLGELRVGAHIYPINTHDISQGGVGIELDQDIEPGTAVVLTLPNLRPLYGVLRWCDGGRAGVSFNQVIPFAELMGWLRSN